MQSVAGERAGPNGDREDDVNITYDQIVEAIELERQWRRQLADEGSPFHYWQYRGDAEPPWREYWCDHCQGFYGVPHNNHSDGCLCANYPRALSGQRYCACIDCIMTAALAANSAPSS